MKKPSQVVLSWLQQFARHNSLKFVPIHLALFTQPTGNCDGSICINCPLANVFTLHSINNSSVLIPQFKKKFIPSKADLVSGVYFKVWRPPVVS